MVAALSNTGYAVGLRLTRLSLRTVGFRRTVATMRSFPKPFASHRSDNAAAVKWADAIVKVGGRPYGATCLDRSVFLWFLMNQRGLEGRIRIGAAFDGDRLEGHAWVEVDGNVVNDAPDIAARFSVFDEDPTGMVFL